MTFNINLFTAPGDVVTARQSTLRDSEYGVVLWIGDATIHLKPEQADVLFVQLGRVLASVDAGAKS